jgi:hypothetical protein
VAASDDLTSPQRELLRRLARGPQPCRGPERVDAGRLAGLGLARPAGSRDEALYEITPAGRQHIAFAGPGFRETASGSRPRVAGSKTPPPAEREVLSTVAELQAAGCAVIAQCDQCQFITYVDLDLFAWRFGAKAVLRGRRQSCVVEGCDGRAGYFSKRPGGRFAPLDDG